MCAAAPLSAERIGIAAERPDQACPSPTPPLGVAPLPASGAPAAGACLIHVPIPDLTDATLEDLDARLARLGSAPAVDLDVNVAALAAPASSAEEKKVRLLYAIKKLSSAARASLQGRRVLVSLSAIDETPRPEVEQTARILLDEELEPYLDRVALPPSYSGSPSADQALFARPWVKTAAAPPGTAAAVFTHGRARRAGSAEGDKEYAGGRARPSR